jgi:hypothetical protein
VSCFEAPRAPQFAQGCAVTRVARYLVQDASTLRDCLCDTLHGPVFGLLGLILQHDHEVVFHWQLRLHSVSHASQVQVSILYFSVESDPNHDAYCRTTYDPNLDTFRVEYLVGPSLLLGLLFNYEFNFTEIMWSFSIWLEAVAIFPQLFVLQRTGEAETITTHYLAALGIYRGLYIPNWIYRYGIP